MYFFYFFLSGFISLMLVRKHVLLCLLSIEYMVISLMFIFSLYCLMLSSFYLYIFFMTFCVCEGSLGLSILVFMIRFHGNDYLNSMFMW
uniref:NADH-ubiquinone oxidoreductase chain 4L n=1 Tax=Nacolus tuberculatus TaxID=2800230 RepID=A0A7T6YCR3_9HEMI|nr:NADH dehydrogenase subunit 4L [Nacolus tuberculatus]QQK57727.1 NADH dehydrogenase subunit 4L [Nacolus tuberculatus]